MHFSHLLEIGCILFVCAKEHCDSLINVVRSLPKIEYEYRMTLQSHFLYIYFFTHDCYCYSYSYCFVSVSFVVVFFNISISLSFSFSFCYRAPVRSGTSMGCIRCSMQDRICLFSSSIRTANRTNFESMFTPIFSASLTNTPRSRQD